MKILVVLDHCTSSVHIYNADISTNEEAEDFLYSQGHDRADKLSFILRNLNTHEAILQSRDFTYKVII